jgi:hypothetical protein
MEQSLDKQRYKKEKTKPMEKYKYGRYIKYEPPKIEGCKLGDELLYFEEATGKPMHWDIEKRWEICLDWMISIRDQNIDNPQSPAILLGNEIIKWMEIRDTFALYMLMRTRWRAFRDTFLLPQAPPEMMELVDFIMYSRMTKEEMWDE